ncbi:hypothetical protein ACJX0J_032214 [Zea mays]
MLILLVSVAFSLCLFLVGLCVGPTHFVPYSVQEGIEGIIELCSGEEILADYSSVFVKLFINVEIWIDVSLEMKMVWEALDMNVVLGAALSIATSIIFFYLAVTGIIKYIADVLLLYFEALLLGKQYMLTCPNLGTFYNALCSILLGDTMGHFQEIVPFGLTFLIDNHLAVAIITLGQCYSFSYIGDDMREFSVFGKFMFYTQMKYRK